MCPPERFLEILEIPQLWSEFQFLPRESEKNTLQRDFYLHTSDNSRVNSVVLYNSREWKYHHSVVLYNSPEWKVLPLSCVV